MIEYDEKVNRDSEEAPTKLTEWENEPSIHELKTELESTKSSQSVIINKIDEWNDLRDITGKAKPKSIKGRSSIQPKLIRKTAEWRYSALTEPFHSAANKLFNVQPATWEDEEAAKQHTLLINWQFRTKIDRVRQIDNIVRSVVDDGTCVVRVGWVQNTRMETTMLPVFQDYAIAPEDEESMMMLEEAMALKQQNPRGFEEQMDEGMKESVKITEETGVPTIAIQVGETEAEIEVVTDNYPTIDVVDLRNIYIDPTCHTNIDDAQFVIHSYEMTKAQLESQPGTYKNLEFVNWDTESPVTDTDHYTQTPTDYNTNIASNKKVVVYDYWGYYDIHGTGEMTPIVASWIGNVLVRLEENPFPDGKPPFVLMVYNPVKRSLYGEPDAPLLEDNQRVIGATTRGLIDLFGRSANSQIGWALGALDALNKRRFENGLDYEFNPTMNPTQAMVQHTYPEAPSSVYNMLEMQTNEAESLSGTKSFTGGISGNAYGDVAAGIRGTLDATSKREMAILRRIVDGVKRIGNKIVAMNSAFLSKEEVVRVTNTEYVEIKHEDLQGNFDLIVDIATAEIDDTKANDLAFLLQTIGPVVDNSITLLVMSEIAELKRMPALANKLKTYQPPPPSEEEQEMMQLELEAKRLEVEKLKSEVEFNRARAKKALAEADSTDLDYLDSESGVKHQRELEKMKAQAEGNMKRDVLKSVIDANKDENKGFDINDTPLISNPDNILTPQQRDEFAKNNPALNLGSQEFDPGLDPSLNLASQL